MFKFITAQLVLGVCSLSLCLAESRATTKVTNGTPAGSYPWMAALVSASDNTKILCGGQIIHPRYVLTAAHCAESLKSAPEEYSVVTGRSRLTATGGVVSKIEGAIIYPLNNPSTNEHDLALLKLTAPVPWDVISLLTPEQSGLAAAGVNGTILGWGLMDSAYQALPDLLQEGTVPIWSDDACEARYGLAFKGSSMLCAGKPETSIGAGDGIDTCKGDSGGPLFVRDGSGILKLVGVTSWGFSCGSKRYPGVYAEVAPYAAWAYSSPAIPPIFRESVNIVGKLFVGETLTCESGAVIGDKPLTYSFTWKRMSENTGSDLLAETIAGQKNSSYKLTTEDEGKFIRCEIVIQNSGGSVKDYGQTYEIVQAAEEVTPDTTPTSVDSVPPKAHLLKKQVTKSAYEIVFTASDDNEDDNISRIEATSVRTSIELCKVKGKKSTRKCKTTKSEFFMADSTGGSSWTISLPRRAQPDRYTLFVRAVDKAGNIQSAPTRVVLVVKQKR